MTFYNNSGSTFSSSEATGSTSKILICGATRGFETWQWHFLVLCDTGQWLNFLDPQFPHP